MGGPNSKGRSPSIKSVIIDSSRSISGFFRRTASVPVFLNIVDGNLLPELASDGYDLRILWLRLQDGIAG
jgi:hypothetical protein